MLILVGTGDSLGVPRVYCECPVCTEARGAGQNRRTRSSALVTGPEGEFWIDCGPDWRLQMEAVGHRRVGTMLLTHAHHDHIGGLPDLYDYARWTQQSVPVLAPPSVLDEVRHRYPWLERGLDFSPVGVAIGGFALQSWGVCHGKNGRSFAYRFSRPGFSWAYCPDSINLDQAEREPLRGLDLLVLGTAYYDEEAPMASRSIYSMVEALELLEDVQPGRVVFTHLSHGVDVRVDYLLPANVMIASDGLCLEMTKEPDA